MAKKRTSALDITQRTTRWVFDNFYYVLFLLGLSVVSIANAHYAEKNVREIQLLQREIKELKWEYASIMSDIMYRSMQSQVSTAVAPMGLYLPPEGPKVIEVK